ncbi:MAG: phosphoribosylanthranilate isomerase [Acidimicrobiales bacterium]
MFVKICGITSESDALLAVGLGADAVGFVFAPSPRQVSARAVQQIVDRLPRDIVTVGVFRNELPQRVVEIVNSLGLRGAQLHGNETPADTRWVAERVPLTIRAFPAGDPGVSKLDHYGAQFVLVDGASPGSGQVFDWRMAEGVIDPGRLIVSGGLNAENVGDAIERLSPYGVDVSSGVETAPGRKDPAAMRAFINAARLAGESAECPAASGLAGTDEGILGAEDGSDGAQSDDEGGTFYDWRRDA